jgi:2-polyprenyl-3-methyl-5-hydroxy-6-metoxy-1,4-benzoquinol methylase
MDNFWEERYRSGGSSGPGSYGESAEYKASVINNYINKLEIKSISDFGCGDGNQISLLIGYDIYHGFDISSFVVDKNIEKFLSKNNMFFYKNVHDLPKSDLTLSLDVIYHVSRMVDFVDYLTRLFDRSKKYVLIFSTDRNEENQSEESYIYFRKFTDWVETNIPDFKLVEKLDNPNGNGVDFYLYERID